MKLITPKVVECINPFFDFSDKLKEAIDNGAVPPKLGERYVVLEDIHISDLKDYPHLLSAGIKVYKGYILDGIDFSEYGLRVAWRKGNFKVVEGDENISIMKFEASFEIDDFDDDIEEQTWVHNGE